MDGMVGWIRKALVWYKCLGPDPASLIAFENTTHSHKKKRESNQESEIFVLGCIPSVLVGRRRFFLETRGTMEGLALWHRMAGIQMLDAGWVQQSVLLVLDSGSSGYSGVL